MPAKAWAAQQLMQRNWKRAPAGEMPLSPWPWAHTWPVARLSAKSGDVELIVLAGASSHTLAFGPGHLSASSIPGERGNSVIAGNRGTHFSFLQDLAVGETLSVETIDGQRHVYAIIDLSIVVARRCRLLLDRDDERLTLVTNYPFVDAETNGKMRYLVTAKKL